jgi:DNA-binding response OmpR family regulator
MAERDRSRGETILVVDDAPDILRLMELFLKSEGYRVVSARSGDEALRLATAERPDLIILDVMMPGIGGLEVCERLRSRSETADVPVIMLSALTQPPDRVKGLRAGADDYVTKPPDRDELLARVAIHLNRARRLREAKVGAAKQGKVFCFMGAKGGVGTTTVTSNVAALLAQQKKSVILLELRPCFGTLALQLKWPPGDNLAHLLDLAPEQITERELGARLFAATSGVRVLFGPQKVEEFRELDTAHTEAIIRQATLMADYVVVDLPHLPAETHRVLADLCDIFTVVLEGEPGCVNTAKVVLRLLRTWGLIGNRAVAVVTNRSGFTTSTSLPDIRAQLGCEIVGVMPFAGEACIAAASQGVPLALFRPENIAASTLRDMVSRLMADTLVGIRV